MNRHNAGPELHTLATSLMARYRFAPEHTNFAADTIDEE